MATSALRVAACAAVLVGGLILSASVAGVAYADPGTGAQGATDKETSKGVNSERPSLINIIHRIISEQRKRILHPARSAPKSKVGSDPDSQFITSEPTVTTVVEAEQQPAPEPESAPSNQRDTDPAPNDDGGSGEGYVPGAEIPDDAAPPAVTAEGGGSDYTDNTVVADDTVAADAPAPVEQLIESVEYPFLYYLLEVRRGGGGWWSATTIIARRQEEIVEPAPAPEPEIAQAPQPEIAQAPQPAFRGPAPEAPAPDPVLDASGGVAGGSDYQATAFGGAPILSAPVIAVPPLLPAAVRFPSAPPEPAAPPGVGSAAARAAGTEPGQTVLAGRTAGPPEQTPAGDLKAMSGQAPRQGYTDYLRRPGLPELAGAALPGVAGILLMSLGGGIIGYRQANAGRMIRASGAARYLP